MKNFFTKLLIVVLCTCASDCKTLYHDKSNPCTPGEFANSKECLEWKKNFPKEYERFIKRTNKSE